MITLHPDVVGAPVPEKQKDVLHEVLEEMQSARAAKSERTQRRHLAMQKRLQVFRQARKPARPAPQHRATRTRVTPLAERSALDLFRD